MKHIGICAALAALTLWTLGACDKGGDNAPAVAAVAPSAASDASLPAGSVRGTIVFDGVAPERKPVPMGGDAGCSKHAGTVLTETVIVNAGHLENVLVYVKSGLDTSHVYPVPSEPVVLEQSACAYRPHVVALRVGQKLTVKNADGFNHNVNAKAQRNGNPDFNQTQSGGAQPLEVVFKSPELLVPFACDIHPWMRSYVHALEHPFFALSDAGGAFAIDSLPPGKYRLEAVHETLGRQELEIVLDGKAGVKATFHFRAGK
jgi:plastocyanin